MLQDLYLGRIRPFERERVHTQEYSAIIHEIDDIVTHFKNLLSSEEYARFEEMQDLQSQANTIDDIDLFEYAFHLGALMMIDILGCKEHD